MDTNSAETPETVSPPVDPSPGSNPGPAHAAGQVFAPSQTPAPTALPTSPNPTVSTTSTSAYTEPTIASAPASLQNPTITPNLSTPAPHRGARHSKKMLMIVPLFLALILGGSAAAYFGYYVPNQPSNLWATSLVNMGKGYDRIAKYTQDYKSSPGSKVSGSFKATGAVTADGTLEGNSEGDNSDQKLNISAAGLKTNLELRTIKSSGQTPDIYIKADGVAGLDSALGSDDPELNQSLDSINGQWYFIDHTLLEQYVSSADGSSATPQFTKQDVNEVVQAISLPSKKYVFTKNSQNMAFVIKQKLGKDTQDGRSTYHYKIGVNKANLKLYNNELCDSLSKTKLFKFFEAGMVNSSDALKDCKDTSDIDQLKDSSAADVWVDTHTKLIHKVRFVQDNKATDYIDLIQDYQGGSELPFSIAFNYGANGSSSNGVLKLTLNMDTNAITIDANAKFGSGDGATKVTATFTGTPTNTAVKVQKPANAKNILELAKDLGLSDLFSGAALADGATTGNIAADTERKTDINALQGQVEAYQAQNGFYPSLANLNDTAWRAKNMKGLDDVALMDPSGTAKALVAAPAAKAYSYAALPAGCDNIKTNCADYTLTATLSTGNTYVKQALNSEFTTTSIIN